MFLTLHRLDSPSLMAKKQHQADDFSGKMAVSAIGEGVRGWGKYGLSLQLACLNCRGGIIPARLDSYVHAADAPLRVPTQILRLRLLQRLTEGVVQLDFG
jgi:hypothetical protein